MHTPAQQVALFLTPISQLSSQLDAGLPTGRSTAKTGLAGWPAPSHCFMSILSEEWVHQSIRTSLCLRSSSISNDRHSVATTAARCRPAIQCMTTSSPWKYVAFNVGHVSLHWSKRSLGEVGTTCRCMQLRNTTPPR